MGQQIHYSDKSKKIEHPLSIGQKGLWLLHQMNPSSDRYNMPLTFKFSDQVNISELEAALNMFVQRHSILRSQFVEINGIPVRVVNPHVTLKISKQKTDIANHQILLNTIADVSGIPFDLENGPLFRATILHNSSERILLLTIHHLVFDGASLKLFFDELEQIYKAIITNNPDVLNKPANLDYQDFQAWQKRWLQSEEAQDSKKYWLKTLSGELPKLNLPYDHGSENNEVIKGMFIKFDIPKSIVSEFRLMARNHKCSEYSVWLTAYFAFLSRYTSESDLVIGTPSMGRPSADYDHIVGYFVNLIPLRCQINSIESFTDLLLRFKDHIYEALVHANYPLATLIDDLGDIHLRGDQPLFQSSFIWTATEHLISGENSVLGLKIHPLLHESGEQDFSFEVLSSTELTQGLFKYRANRFSDSSINRIKHSFINFLNNLCLEPDSELRELSLVDEGDEQHLLFDLNNCAATTYEKNSIHSIFEKQALENPDQTAISFQGQVFSYQILNQKANQLAEYLIKSSVKPNDLIGLCIERSVEMFVCILGILKAGGAYIPLEPSYPDNRLKNIINDSQPKYIITLEKWRNLLSEHANINIFFDENKTQEILKSCSKNNPDLKTLNDDNLAYVIYTSGSTGKPKGVLQKHKTLINLVHSQIREGGLKLPLKTLQFAPFSFDVSIQELATCWYSGSELILISQQDKDDISRLPELLKEHKIERLFLPPQVLNWLVLTLKDQKINLDTLKEIIVAGDALIVTAHLKEYLIENACRLWNHYGPTETHVVTTACFDQNICTGAVPIGSVLANLSVYILDEFKQLVPYGAVGELYVGGAGLADGYINNKKLTEERFVQHPYSFDENDLLYRTGDLVRYISDNCLEFIGRIDRQVKINGFRIELGEIEQQLNFLAYVKSAFVIVHEGSNKHKYLLAYITTHSPNIEVDLTANARLALQAILPSYMIPSKIILVDELPLTANGKVDSKLLPTPDEAVFNQAYVAPSGEIELTLLHIWSVLLNLAEDKISTQANFFELGGHSLLATQLINEIKQSFDIELAYTEIFTYSIFGELSDLIKQHLMTNKLIQELEESEDTVDEVEW